MSDARRRFVRGEALLRDAADHYGLAMLLVLRGMLDLVEEGVDRAETTLHDAQKIADMFNVGPESELALRINTLREAIVHHGAS